MAICSRWRHSSSVRLEEWLRWSANTSWTDSPNPTRRPLALRRRGKKRYHEKQAAAVAGTYEKLAGYLATVSGLYLYEAASLSHDEEERIPKELDEADQARIDFQKFFTANEIYFPASLPAKSKS